MYKQWLLPWDSVEKKGGDHQIGSVNRDLAVGTKGTVNQMVVPDKELNHFQVHILPVTPSWYSSCNRVCNSCIARLFFLLDLSDFLCNMHRCQLLEMPTSIIISKYLLKTHRTCRLQQSGLDINTLAGSSAACLNMLRSQWQAH